ncbi:NAD-dependent epimerase/dehydratase family protein [Burkholderia sp. L27(2015)]|uniref:NAD-dependent epimerase/dehydratase family protein n=1 Tax=Burkholderia sp. L27(2015) TaxID=1641858 RepID=UPI00131AB887|nr:NAD-dependent epimerase/dehydratase family protein [Burkholderia sp. L27(2015)]
MKVLVTGATGFVGQALCERLLCDGHEVVAATRDSARSCPATTHVVVGEIDADTRWTVALDGVELVYHLAGRAHVMAQEDQAALEHYECVNLHGTTNLARQAVAAGVRRLVFVSSIKVNGEGGEDVYTSTTPPAPRDPYGASKWQAECALRKISQDSTLEIVVVRPPLIYGPGVKANFLRLLGAVERGLPLPFGLVRNQRSLLFLGNLVDLLTVCASHPAAVGNTYLASDGNDVSTAELVRQIASALSKPTRLLPISPGLIRLLGRLLGKGPAVARLLGSLQVDSSPLQRDLHWEAPFTLQEGLRITAEWYKKKHERNA